MTPEEALLLHLQIGIHMMGEQHGPSGYFRFATNAAWPGGLAETLVSLLFANADNKDWAPNHESYVDAALRKTAGGETEELRSLSLWRAPRQGKGKGNGSITDVDLFVLREGLSQGYWRQFQTLVPDTISRLLDSQEQAFGCQVKLRLDWLEEADDGHDSLHWGYFVPGQRFDLAEFVGAPTWLPQPVDLFVVAKFSAQQGGISARGRIFDKWAVRDQILRSVRERMDRGVKSLEFGSQRFSFGECMAFPAGTGIEISDPLTRLIRRPVPTE
ncbi:hypothetical protein ARTHRO8AJ_380050 [Arthrobacter sp. 8AJ]|nr:hypothetical protein ARTHRO8AJ_380050 [Arthrobacter sp. 8AJ]